MLGIKSEHWFQLLRLINLYRITKVNMFGFWSVCHKKKKRVLFILSLSFIHLFCYVLDSSDNTWLYFVSVEMRKKKETKVRWYRWDDDRWLAEFTNTTLWMMKMTPEEVVWFTGRPPEGTAEPWDGTLPATATLISVTLSGRVWPQLSILGIDLACQVLFRCPGLMSDHFQSLPLFTLALHLWEGGTGKKTETEPFEPPKCQRLKCGKFLLWISSPRLKGF